MKYVAFDKLMKIRDEIVNSDPTDKEGKLMRIGMINAITQIIPYAEELNECSSYYKKKHEFLLEDAKCFVANYIANKNNCDVDDIDEEELNKYDYEYLVNEYEDKEDSNISFNEMWEIIVENYMDDFDEE